MPFPCPVVGRCAPADPVGPVDRRHDSGELAALPGGSFLMGTDDPDGLPEDREGWYVRSPWSRSRSTPTACPTNGLPRSLPPLTRTNFGGRYRD
jgi:hypothetical protein